MARARSESPLDMASSIDLSALLPEDLKSLGDSQSAIPALAKDRRLLSLVDQLVRLLSVISTDDYQRWFQQVWTGLTGASTRDHPAPYPLELTERPIRMLDGWEKNAHCLVG